MSLQTGLYFIMTEDRKVLSRHMVEDLSLLPKRVYFLNEDMGRQRGPTLIEKKGDQYVIKLGGAATGFHDDNFVAHLLDMGGDSNRQLVLQQRGGGYVILDPTTGLYLMKGPEEGPGALAKGIRDPSAATVCKLEQLG